MSGHTDTLTEASNLFDEFYKRGEIENDHQYRNALDKFSTQKTEFPSKNLEQLAFNTKPKIEELMLIFTNKSNHEELPSQPLEIKNEQFKIAGAFLIRYNGIFNVTNKEDSTLQNQLLKKMASSN